MNDLELLEWCLIKFGYNSFTGNELVQQMRLKGNAVHMQLFRISKSNVLFRYSYNGYTRYCLVEPSKRKKEMNKLRNRLQLLKGYANGMDIDSIIASIEEQGDLEEVLDLINDINDMLTR